MALLKCSYILLFSQEDQTLEPVQRAHAHLSPVEHIHAGVFLNLTALSGRVSLVMKRWNLYDFSQTNFRCILKVSFGDTYAIICFFLCHVNIPTVSTNLI